MNTGSTIQSLRETNPPLFNHLVEHPSLRVVECYFHLASLEFHTLWVVAELLKTPGFTEDEIAEAMKIYMKF